MKTHEPRAFQTASWLARLIIWGFPASTRMAGYNKDNSSLQAANCIYRYESEFCWQKVYLKQDGI